MFDRLVLRRVLDVPSVYERFQKIIAKKNARDWFVKEYIGDTSDKKILDLGCGTADILDYIRDERVYVGVDNNKNYIEKNKKRFSGRNTCKFCYADLNAYFDKETERYDIVLMVGVIHHIDDDAFHAAMTNIKQILTEDGILISLDACFTREMNPIARLLCMLDRGRFVRYVEDYVELHGKHWETIKYNIRTDTLRFLPYSVIVFKNSGAICDV